MADALEVSQVDPAATVAELLAEGRAGDVERSAWREAIDALQPALLEERLSFKPTKTDGSWRAAAADVAAGLALDGGWTDADLPFGPLWAPLAAAETERLSLAFPKEAARRFLLQKLCGGSTRCLLAELAVFREMESARFASFDPESDEGFRAFIARLRETRGKDLFEAYPALLRVLSVVLTQWRANMRQLSARLSADFPGKKIVDVAFGLSDPHEGGRSAAVLTFAGGRRLVYKPKPLDTEAWFNAHFGGVEVLAKDGYGYAAFAERADFTSKKAVSSYFESAGKLLFDAWLLGASDLHFENVIATKAGPVPIDLETLCCPRPKIAPEADDVANRAQYEFYFDSVVRTMLLPSFELLDGNRLVEPSGLAGGPAGGLVEAWEWSALNKDRMRLKTAKVPAEAAANLPLLKGKPVSAADYLPQIETGFAKAYRAAMRPAARRKLSSALDALAALPTRFVFRNTKIYRHLLDKSLSPASLQSGVAYSLCFEPLWRVLSTVDDKEERARLGRCASLEIEALARRDVPVFKTKPGEAFAALEGVRALELNEAPLGLCRERLARLSEDDLAKQLRFTRACFHALTAGRGAAPARQKATPAASDERAFIKKISDRVLGGALIGRNDEAWWLSLSYNERQRNFQYGPVGSRLFDGALGICLFLAASSRITRDERAARVARATSRLVARDAKRFGMARLTRNLGLGVATGASSIPYGLHAIGTILGQSDLVDDATAFAKELSVIHLAADDARHTDVVSGTAGALLCLRRLGLSSKDLEAAFRRGCEELAGRLERGEKAALGFAHGAAGAAYAAKTLGWDDVSRRLLRLVDERFSADEGNWPDYRDFGQGDRPRYVLSWCGGAAGIGLAAVECGEKGMAERAVAACLKGEEAVDHLCCGEAGVAAFLRRAGREREARARLARIMAREPLRMGFDAGAPLPSLFQGEAGVAQTASELLALEPVATALFLAA